MRVPPDRVFKKKKISRGKLWVSMICFKVHNTDKHNFSLSDNKRPNTIVLAHTDLWQSTFDKITDCLINAQTLARTWKQWEFSIISPVVILPPACPLMGLHWKPSRLAALGSINPVMAVIKTELGNPSCNQSLPAGQEHRSAASNLDTGEGISCREVWHQLLSFTVKGEEQMQLWWIFTPSISEFVMKCKDGRSKVDTERGPRNQISNDLIRQLNFLWWLWPVCAGDYCVSDYNNVEPRSVSFRLVACIQYSDTPSNCII